MSIKVIKSYINLKRGGKEGRKGWPVTGRKPLTTLIGDVQRKVF